MTDTTAKPKAYHLQIRLIDAHGVSFNNVDFRVTWGNDKKQGKTTADGGIDLLVDGGYGISGGTLELGNVKGGKFVPSVTIGLKKHQPESTRKIVDNFTQRRMYGDPVPYEMSFDIAWRLANLMYLPWIPTTPTYYGMEPAPSIPGDTKAAVMRFKAFNHEALDLTDWLVDPAAEETDALPKFRRLRPVQDDAFLKLLLVQHDDITPEQAQKKLDNARLSTSDTTAGEPL